MTRAPAIELHQLDVYLVDGRAVDVRLNGESVHPTWFKLEFKESGDVSAKIKGLRLSCRAGDTIRIHTDESLSEPSGSARPVEAEARSEE